MLLVGKGALVALGLEEVDGVATGTAGAGGAGAGLGTAGLLGVLQFMY